MTAEEKYLTPYGLYEDKTFDQYCARIPVWFFKKEVPEDVRKNFEVVEQLLAHSYYEYRFIDEAYAKALHTLEMAMNMRYKELTNAQRNLRFPKLIRKLHSLNQFETTPQILEHLKWMRDYYSHPSSHSFGGIFTWGRIEPIAFLINEMYEDPNLRAKRKALEKSFQETQLQKNLKQFMVLDDNWKKTILYMIQLLFIDNKEDPNVYHFSGIPLFDLKHTDGGLGRRVPEGFGFSVTNVSFLENTFECNLIDNGSQIKLYPIVANETCQREFNSWNEEYLKIPHRHFYDFDIVSVHNHLYYEVFWEFLKK
jgi:hypothetical protein